MQNPTAVVFISVGMPDNGHFLLNVILKLSLERKCYFHLKINIIILT